MSPCKQKSMLPRLLIAVLIMACVTRCGSGLTQEFDKPVSSEADQIAEQRRLIAEANDHVAKADPDTAIDKGLQILKLQQSIGDNSEIDSADIHNWLVQLYLGAGKYEDAIAMAEKALQSQTDRWGTAGWQTVSARFQVDYAQRLAKADSEIQKKLLSLEKTAQQLAKDEKFAEAAEMILRLVPIETEILGDQHPNLALTYAAASANWMHTDRKDNCQAAAESCLKIRLASYGLNHPDTAAAHFEVAECLAASQELSPAINQYSAALEIYRVLELSGDVARCYSLMGACWRKKNDHESASRAYESAARKFEESKQSEQAGESRLEYGKELEILERYETAAQEFQGARQRFQEAKSPINAAWLLIWRGDALVRVPDEEKAIAAFTTASDEFSTLGVKDGVAISEQRLGNVLMQQKRFPEANTHLKSAAATYISLKQNDEYASVQKTILDMYEKWFDQLATGTDAVQATSVLQDWLACQREQLGPVNSEVAGTLMRLAILYERGLKDFAAARDAHQQRLEILTQILDSDHPQIADAQFAVKHVTLLAGLTAEQIALNEKAQRFVQHAGELFREGRVEDAHSKIASALEIYYGMFGDESPEYANSLGTQALMYKLKENFVMAEPLYVQSAELTRRQRGAKHPSYADALQLLGELYQTTGKLNEAAETFRTALGVYQTAGVSGSKYEETAETMVQTLQSLSWENLTHGNIESAQKELQEVFDLQRSIYGDKDWRTVEAQVAIERTQGIVLSEKSIALLKEANENFDPRSESDPPSESAIRKSLEILGQVLGTQHPQYLLTLLHFGKSQAIPGHWDSADETFSEAARLSEQLYGQLHPYNGAALLNRAKVLSMKGKFTDARRLAEQAESIFLATMGNSNRALLDSIITLGDACLDIGEFTEALRHFERAMQLNRAIIASGKQDDMFAFLEYEEATANGRNPNHIQILRGLAQANQELRNLPEAVTYYESVRDLLRSETGSPTEAYAISISNVASVYLEMNDYQQAETLYYEALAIDKQINGPGSPGISAIWNNLGRLYFMMGQITKAEDAYRRALSIPDEVGDVQGDRRHSVFQDNLALALVAKGAYQEAEQLYLDALRLKKASYGENHAMYAVSLMNLGEMYREMGRMSEARVRLEAACPIMLSTLGAEHREYRNARFSLAKLNWQAGEFAMAEEQLFQILKSARDEISRNAIVQSERQQLAGIRALRYQLDLYIGLTSQTLTDPEHVYEQILAWKGSVLQRQQRIRRFRQDPEVLQQATMLERGRNDEGEMVVIMQVDSANFDRLDQVNSRITRLALGLPSEVESEQQRVEFLQVLSENKERLERELSKMVSDLKSQVQEPLNPVLPKDLRDCLPPESALIDFFEYTHTTPSDEATKSWTKERRFVAMIVRKDQPVRRIELGSAELLSIAVDTWLAAVIHGDAADAGNELRRLIWLPVAQELHDTKLLFVSPDGPLARIPLAAIPGGNQGSFLIQDFAIVNVASAQLLPEIVANTSEPDPLPGRVLVVGGVNYDHASAPATNVTTNVALPARSGEIFEPLAGTQEELNVIEGLYASHFGSEGLLTLQADDATEDNFRLQAPNYPILHLGTHGFFASTRFQAALNSSVAREIPGASRTGQSLDDYYPGLLSGIAFAGANRPVPDLGDGILTAEEVASMDLSRVDLTVLSACETGLGAEAARGESLMSLQRAFQIAGSRTVVSTLWKVPDKGTQALMSEFYRNLWEKKLGKLEALRQAQLSMLRGYDPATGTIQSRGATIDGQPIQPTVTNIITPYYWGAFTLTGDWQ